MKMKRKVKKQLILLWGKVGFIVQLSQMVEYNLANILAFDEILREFEERDSMFVIEYTEFVEKSNKWYKDLSKMPLGLILQRAKDIQFFTEESENLLSEAITKRNYIVHRLFKEDLKKSHLETDPPFYFDELETTIGLLNAINESLIRIFKQQKDEFKLIW